MKKILLVLVCMVTMISLQAQNFNRSINLNMICVNDTTFDPFDANTVCDGMTQTGKLVITK